MGLFDSLFSNKSTNSFRSSGAIDYGRQKQNGSHDHRTNTGDDRTPAQKSGDQSKKKK